MSTEEIKELTVTYTVNLATYTPKALIASKDDLYDLFDEVFYNSAENVAGVTFLIKKTDLRIEGKE